MAGYLSSCLSAMSKLDQTATDSHGTNASCQHIVQAIKDLNEASYLTELAEMKQNAKTLKVRIIALMGASHLPSLSPDRTGLSTETAY